MEAKNEDWRDVVYAHLQAYHDDVRRTLEADVSGSEAQFLRQCGTQSLNQAHDRAANARHDALGQPASKESYEVIEESLHRILAQVRPNRISSRQRPVPYWTTRFLLIEDESGWKIARIYSPCISCNARATRDDAPMRGEPGKCYRCEGKGTDIVRKVHFRGVWIFKRRVLLSQPCERCGGTGNCPDCAGKEMLGWRNIFSLNGLTDTTTKT